MAENASRPRPAPALVASVAFGVLGVVLIIVGAIVDSNAVLVAGAGAGVLSLVAALVWRSQLIDAWHRQRDAGGGST